MNIPFLDLSASSSKYRHEINQSISNVISSSEFILGSHLSRFEANYSDFVSSDWCLGVNSGFDALKLALLAEGIGVNDEVIVPELTFIATWQAVVEVGAIPVPCPIDPSTFLLDCYQLPSVLTKNTKCIIPVHLYGQACDLNLINDFASCHSLSVVEDAAQCHGATYESRRIGSHGNLVCWSFYPGKILGAYGDGGAITGFSEEHLNFIQSYRNYGSVSKYQHDTNGVNSRLDDIQASILDVKLRYLVNDIDERMLIASLYQKYLSNISKIILPSQHTLSSHSWHLYVIRTKYRDQLKSFLSSKGINTLIHYPKLPFHYSPFQSFYPEDFLPTDIHKYVLSLPIYPGLCNSQIIYITDSIHEFFDLRT